MTDLNDPQPITAQDMRWTKWLVCLCVIALVPLVALACAATKHGDPFGLSK